MFRPLRRTIPGLLLLLSLVPPGAGSDCLAASRPAVRGRSGMVVSADRIASEVGRAVLIDGGTAVDAAVATAFALAVVHPQAGNLGGGGFALVRDGQTGAASVVDFRETAPAAASPRMFLGTDGEPVPGASTEGYLSVAVPGSVAGLEMLHQKYGLLSWRKLLAPSVRLARRGFPVNRELARDIADKAAEFARHPTTAAVFLREGKPLGEGELLRQPDLARTLLRIAREGSAGFYRGPVAEAIASDITAHGGILTRRDLAEYRPRIRRPLEGTYAGYRLLVVPPPSSGGVVLLELLNILEPYAIGRSGPLSSRTVHLMTEAERRAYADRTAFLGDPDFFDVPVESLLSKQYALTRGSTIQLDRATPSASIGPGEPRGAPPSSPATRGSDGTSAAPPSSVAAGRPGSLALPPAALESPDTTHLVVVDRWRNVVSMTTTLNDLFGSKVVAAGTGVLLNDEMDDFAVKPGATNLYGLVGGVANEIRPGKRPLSSMCPTIVLKDDRPLLALGTPGGGTIITSVAQVFLNIVEHGMELQEAVDAPRVHHQWIPDTIQIEPRALSADVRTALEKMGHTIVVRDPIGDLQAIRIDSARGTLQGASDPRGAGGARGY